MQKITQVSCPGKPFHIQFSSSNHWARIKTVCIILPLASFLSAQSTVSYYAYDYGVISLSLPDNSHTGNDVHHCRVIVRHLMSHNSDNRSEHWANLPLTLWFSPFPSKNKKTSLKHLFKQTSVLGYIYVCITNREFTFRSTDYLIQSRAFFNRSFILSIR